MPRYSTVLLMVYFCVQGDYYGALGEEMTGYTGVRKDGVM